MIAEVSTMLLNIALCDDSIDEINTIGNYITAFSVQNNIDFHVSKFQSGEELLKSYDETPTGYDLLFLDVEMPGINRIETAQKIRDIPDRNVLIFFITSYPEYMQDSFDVQAYQYLTKPLSYELFESKMKKAIKYLDDIQTNIAVSSLKNGEIILHLDDVICFETIKSLTKKSDILVTTVHDSFQIKDKIADLEQQLHDKYFISVHRSALVNLKYIKRFNANQVELTNGKVVEASRRKIAVIKKSFSKYMVVRYKK